MCLISYHIASFLFFPLYLLYNYLIRYVSDLKYLYIIIKKNILQKAISYNSKNIIYILLSKYVI